MKLGLSKMETQVSSLQTSFGALEEKQLSVAGDINGCSGKADAAMAAANAAGDAAKAAAAAVAAAALVQGKEGGSDGDVAPTASIEEIRRIAKEEVRGCSML